MFPSLGNQKILPAFPTVTQHPLLKHRFLSGLLGHLSIDWLYFFLDSPNFPLTTSSLKSISLTHTVPWYHVLQTENSMKAPSDSSKKSPGQPSLTLHCSGTQLQFPALQPFNTAGWFNTSRVTCENALAIPFLLYVCVSYLHTSNKASKHKVLITFQVKDCSLLSNPSQIWPFKNFLWKVRCYLRASYQKNRQQLFAGLVIWSLQQHTPDTVLQHSVEFSSNTSSISLTDSGSGARLSYGCKHVSRLYSQPTAA